MGTCGSSMTYRSSIVSSLMPSTVPSLAHRDPRWYVARAWMSHFDATLPHSVLNTSFCVHFNANKTKKKPCIFYLFNLEKRHESGRHVLLCFAHAEVEQHCDRRSSFCASRKRFCRCLRFTMVCMYGPRAARGVAQTRPCRSGWSRFRTSSRALLMWITWPR